MVIATLLQPRIQQAWTRDARYTGRAFYPRSSMELLLSHCRYYAINIRSGEVVELGVGRQGSAASAALSLAMGSTVSFEGA